MGTKKCVNPACELENVDGGPLHKFCYKCGTSFEEGAEESSSAEPPEKPAASKVFRGFLLFLVPAECVVMHTHSGSGGSDDEKPEESEAAPDDSDGGKGEEDIK